MLREAGAREVHLRIPSPPVRWSCFYGIDTGDRTELLAHKLDVEAIRRYLDVDTLAYLDLDRLVSATGAAGFKPVPLTWRSKRAGGRDADERERSAGPRRHHRLTWSETYRDAGVDIAAGEAAVERIKDTVRSTYRPEVVGDIGGFGGVMGLPAGYRDPVLVSSTDGVGTKAMVARAAGRYDTIGIDLVAMCVDDIVCQGVSPCSSSTTSPWAGSTPTRSAPSSPGWPRAAAGRAAPWWAARWPSTLGLDPGEFDLVGFVVGVAERERLLTGDAVRGGDVLWACPRPACGPTATRWPGGCCSSVPAWASTTSCSAAAPWRTSC